MTADQPRAGREALIAAAARRMDGIDAQLARAAEADPEAMRVQELSHASDLALQAHSQEAYSVYLLQLGREADAAECRAVAAETAEDASFWAAPDPEPEAEAEP